MEQETKTVLSISKPAPMWATWLFRCIFIITGIITFVVAADPEVSIAFKARAAVYLKAIDMATWGIGRILGIEVKRDFSFGDTAQKIVIFLVFSAALFLLSCSPQRKVQKAIHTVTYNDSAFNHVGRLWEKFNPCVNDTILRSDTISEPVYIEQEINADSLRDVICDTSKPQAQIIRVPSRCPDQRTITHDRVVRDTRHEGILRDSLQREKDARVYAQAQHAAAMENNTHLQAQLVAQTKAYAGQLTRRTVIMGIPLLLLILALIFRKRIPFLN